MTLPSPVSFGLPNLTINAVQTEGKASIRVKTFAATIKEPLPQDALEMDGGEEARHKAVLSSLVARYGVALEPEPDYLPPTDAEWAWLITGYSECIDSFFAFGLFALAKQSGYFSPERVETFEPVIQEEARHILFFANWLAWHRCNLSLLRRLQIRPPIRLPARNDVRHLRYADVRGDAPNRLLRQLDGVAGGAARPQGIAAAPCQFRAVLWPRDRPADRHCEAWTGRTARISRRPRPACFSTASVSGNSSKSAMARTPVA